MEYSDYIKTLKQEINGEIRRILWKKEPATLYGPMFYLLDAGGKRIRPILVVLSCQAVGGRIKDCIDAALAVELLHSFTLIHDDIMDHDDLRRGRPTVHKRWDDATAILAGDGLVTLAYSTLLKTHHPKIEEVLHEFTNGLADLCEGQALDKEFETKETISTEEYDVMISKKTARLIEVSCTIGAILGNGDKGDIEIMKRFALSLGKAFQIQDDLLDIMSEEDVSGKPRGSDLIRKKKTYLTTYFFNNASPSIIDRFHQLWNKETLTCEEMSKLIDLLEKSGAVQRAREEVENRINSAVNDLDGLRPGKARETLKHLTYQIQQRVS